MRSAGGDEITHNGFPRIQLGDSNWQQDSVEEELLGPGSFCRSWECWRWPLYTGNRYYWSTHRTRLPADSGGAARTYIYFQRSTITPPMISRCLAPNCTIICTKFAKLADVYGNEQKHHWREDQTRKFSSGAYCSNPARCTRSTASNHRCLSQTIVGWATVLNRPVVAALATASDAVSSLAAGLRGEYPGTHRALITAAGWRSLTFPALLTLPKWFKNCRGIKRMKINNARLNCNEQYLTKLKIPWKLVY